MSADCRHDDTIPEDDLLAMRYTTFRYNTETCQYERVRVSAGNVLTYVLGLAVMASLMLISFLLAHDWLVNTDRENSLRAENKALKKHHAALMAQLEELQPVLTSLERKDKILHEKFFGAPPKLPAQTIDRASKQDLLLADPQAFRAQVALLCKTSDELTARSVATNVHYGNKIRLTKESLPTLNALPTLQPVQPWKSDGLISGFGMRVNPFHKGLYEHLGVDIAMPRGTPVVATASGTVIQIKESYLQAGYGNYVDIDHGNGVITRYAHLDEIKVRYGAKVSKRQVIGTVGSSGGSIAPHVHYEIIRNGTNVDPVHYMVEGLSPAEHYLLTVKSHQQNQSLD